MLRNALLLLSALTVLASFAYGFVALMSHAWEIREGRRVGIDAWMLVPRMTRLNAVPALADGIQLSVVRYGYEVAGRQYAIARLSFENTPPEYADVHHMGRWPQIAYADPGFPWVTLVAIPVLLCMFALWLVRSRQITRVLEDTAAARERIAARKPVLR
ncbi:MAG: hypothetical protein E6Q88_12090 [Lysobacteraceae bacterium]|nr:MAG: hypothetical protein E6Q88_12090 [Xanthomonadaceae bacterium]